MDYNLILKRIKGKYDLYTDKQLCEFLGIKQTTLSSWRSRNSADLELIIAKCNDIDLNWLFRGEKQPKESVDMLNESDQPHYNSKSDEVTELKSQLASALDSINNLTKLLMNR